MVIAVLLCYPLTFSGFTVPAYLFCISFMISFRKRYCSLPTAFFLSSVCQSTDVHAFFRKTASFKTVYNLLSNGDIQAPRCQHNYKGIETISTLSAEAVSDTKT